ncbi:MAG: DegT/DnrJ/EryC1/StrS family aminotransferase [Bryobacterales bacterium]|nr:DegT/DnrJ/EryC1/StrS family aminotransferase [Bryobacterales bacterium]
MVVQVPRQAGRLDIPMFDLRGALSTAGDAIAENLTEFHRRGQFILGPQTASFEAEFAQAMGGADAVGTGNGTAALELCLRDAGIGSWGASRRGDEVIVPSMTSLFTAQAVLSAGARLRVADVSPEDLLLTAEAVDRAWTPATRAVIAVHLYGQTCDLPALAALCKERDAVLVQDACQAHGAFHQGRPLSAFSPYCAYSFYPTKNLGCLGDGGAVVTSDREIAARLRQLRDGGRRGDQVCRGPGLNSRLDEMHACYLRAFLPHLETFNATRRKLASAYADRLRHLDSPRLLKTTSESVFHLCVARSDRRDELRTHLASRGVQTGIHYPVAIHEQPGLLPYASWREVPVHAAKAAKEILSLPIGPHLSLEQVDSVASAVEEFA